MTQPTADPDVRIRPFADWLQEQSSGRTHNDLSEALHELLDAVARHGKAGKLVFTIKVAPMQGDMSAVVIADDVKLAAPEADRKANIFFLDGDGNPVRSDPRQMHLPLRDATGVVLAETKAAT